MSAVGVKIDQFDVPVCNSFQDKILNDQLCYEVDLNNFKNVANTVNELKTGFVFVMDYNEDRQFNFLQDFEQRNNKNFATRVFNENESEQASIYLNTLGKFVKVDIENINDY